MADCGVTEFMRGGVLAETQVTNSTITDTRVTASDLASCNIKNLASIDDASARTIATALANLPEGALSELVKAISKELSLSFMDAGSAPDMTIDPDLPVTLAGSRDALLGRPSQWYKYQGYVIPAYTEKR